MAEKIAAIEAGTAADRSTAAEKIASLERQTAAQRVAVIEARAAAERVAAAEKFAALERQMTAEQVAVAQGVADAARQSVRGQNHVMDLVHRWDVPCFDTWPWLQAEGDDTAQLCPLLPCTGTIIVGLASCVKLRQVCYVVLSESPSLITRQTLALLVTECIWIDDVRH